MIDYSGRSAHKFRNEDLPWLITSQRQYELDELVEVYRALAPKCVLEIGSQEGGTLYQWIKHAIAGAHIINIDILQGRHTEKERNDILQRWHDWKKEREISLVSLIGKSQDDVIIQHVKERLPEGIDFLFIDGDHTYQGAKLDFENYGPMVNSGGIIAFHDLMTPKNNIQNHIQIGKLWKEIQHAGYITRELWPSSDPDWGGIGIIYV